MKKRIYFDAPTGGGGGVGNSGGPVYTEATASDDPIVDYPANEQPIQVDQYAQESGDTFDSESADTKARTGRLIEATGRELPPSTAAPAEKKDGKSEVGGKVVPIDKLATPPAASVPVAGAPKIKIDAPPDKANTETGAITYVFAGDQTAIAEMGKVVKVTGSKSQAGSTMQLSYASSSTSDNAIKEEWVIGLARGMIPGFDDWPSAKQVLFMEALAGAKIQPDGTFRPSRTRLEQMQMIFDSATTGTQLTADFVGGGQQQQQAFGILYSTLTGSTALKDKDKKAVARAFDSLQLSPADPQAWALAYNVTHGTPGAPIVATADFVASARAEAEKLDPKPKDEKPKEGLEASANLNLSPQSAKDVLAAASAKSKKNWEAVDTATVAAEGTLAAGRQVLNGPPFDGDTDAAIQALREYSTNPDDAPADSPLRDDKKREALAFSIQSSVQQVEVPVLEAEQAAIPGQQTALAEAKTKSDNLATARKNDTAITDENAAPPAQVTAEQVATAEKKEADAKAKLTAAGVTDPATYAADPPAATTTPALKTDKAAIPTVEAEIKTATEELKALKAAKKPDTVKIAAKETEIAAKTKILKDTRARVAAYDAWKAASDDLNAKKTDQTEYDTYYAQHAAYVDAYQAYQASIAGLSSLDPTVKTALGDLSTGIDPTRYDAAKQALADRQKAIGEEIHDHQETYTALEPAGHHKKTFDELAKKYMTADGYDKDVAEAIENGRKGKIHSLTGVDPVLTQAGHDARKAALVKPVTDVWNGLKTGIGDVTSAYSGIKGLKEKSKDFDGKAITEAAGIDTKNIKVDADKIFKKKDTVTLSAFAQKLAGMVEASWAKRNKEKPPFMTSASDKVAKEGAEVAAAEHKAAQEEQDALKRKFKQIDYV